MGTCQKVQAVSLAVVLADPGKMPEVGFELGLRPAWNGVGRYVSPFGSYRYVAYVKGRPVSGLQVVSRDRKTAIVANVYTVASHRREGWATELLRHAKQDFKTVQHAAEEDLSTSGKKWRDNVG